MKDRNGKQLNWGLYTTPKAIRLFWDRVYQSLGFGDSMKPDYEVVSDDFLSLTGKIDLIDELMVVLDYPETIGDDKIPSFIVAIKHAQEILKLIYTHMQHELGTKNKLKALRAAIDAGVIRRPTEKEFKVAFPDISVPKSCLSDYTNPDKTPYCDSAFSNLVEEFKQYK